MPKRSKCKVCGKPLVRNMRKEIPPEMYLSDPFCSAACARKFYDNELPPPQKGGRRGDSATRS